MTYAWTPMCITCAQLSGGGQRLHGHLALLPQWQCMRLHSHLLAAAGTADGHTPEQHACV